MAQFINTDTLKFQLFDSIGINDILETDHYNIHDLEGLEMYIDSVTDFSEKELFPYFQEMDAQPAHFKDGKIIAHPQVGKMFTDGVDLGIIAAPIEEKDGGLQLPLSIHTLATAIMDAANNSLPGYTGLTLGALELILAFGSDVLKAKYSEPMLSGQFAGTMCLTEPQAGSSLSDITTTAVPQEDGTYKIKGQKIFISGGDHEYVENVVHLVLARIEGAPAGTKGISLFTVPKLTMNGASNDVQTAGEFHKMGQKGYCTVHLMFGEKDGCVGELVGSPHKGLSYMFKMMNGARIAVGRGAAAIAMAAYEASLKYANERAQGRKIQNSGAKDLNQEQTLIIHHPDVRRMLLSQKSISEGAMSLVLQAAHYHDKSTASSDPEEKEKYHLLLELLTPMVKTYPSEMGLKSVSYGVQVLGGYGYCTEYLLQQYLRDLRIFPIYEGTTGIQSIDLLGRKMTMNNGRAPQLLAQEINKSIMKGMNIPEFQSQSMALGKRLKDIAEIMDHLGSYAAKGNFSEYLADASLFMTYFSTTCVAWQWLKMALTAHEMLENNEKKYGQDFLKSKTYAMQYFFHYELRETDSLKNIIMDPTALTLQTENEVII